MRFRWIYVVKSTEKLHGVNRKKNCTWLKVFLLLMLVLHYLVWWNINEKLKWEIITKMILKAFQTIKTFFFQVNFFQRFAKCVLLKVNYSCKFNSASFSSWSSLKNVQNCYAFMKSTPLYFQLNDQQRIFHLSKYWTLTFTFCPSEENLSYFLSFKW